MIRSERSGVVHQGHAALPVSRDNDTTIPSGVGDIRKQRSS